MIGACGLSAACGCGRTPQAPAPHTRLAVVAQAYAHFLAEHQGRLPRDQNQLKEFIQGSSTLLEKAGASDIEQLFISERDNQPLVLLFNSQRQPLAAAGIIGHEQVGVDGRRLVAYRFGNVEELDEAQFNTLLTPQWR